VIAELRFEGAEPLIRRLTEIEARSSAIIGQALRAASQPIVDSAKSKIPVRTGSLARAQGAVIRRRRNGAGGYAAIGARRGVTAREGIEPANYDHLVESGTAPHDIPVPVTVDLEDTGRAIRVIRHPGARPQPHLGPAVQSAGPAAAEMLRNKISVAIKEAERMY
jgi:HK97 gp10 family phage protein